MGITPTRLIASLIGANLAASQKLIKRKMCALSFALKGGYSNG